MHTHRDRISLDDGQFAVDIGDGIVLRLGTAYYHRILAQRRSRCSLGGKHRLLDKHIEGLTIFEALIFSLEWRKRVALFQGVFAAADGERSFFYGQCAADIRNVEVRHRTSLDFDFIFAHGRSRCSQTRKNGGSNEFAALDGVFECRVLIAIEAGDTVHTHRDGIGSYDSQFTVDIRNFIVLRLGAAYFDRILPQVGDRGSLGGEHRLRGEHLGGLAVLEALENSLEFGKRVALLHGVFAAADGERSFFYGQCAANIRHIEILHRAGLDFDFILAHL